MTLPRQQLNSELIEDIDASTGVILFFSSAASPLRALLYTNDIPQQLRRFKETYPFCAIEEHESLPEAFEQAASRFHHLRVQLDIDRHPPSPDEETVCPVCNTVVRTEPIHPDDVASSTEQS